MEKILLRLGGRAKLKRGRYGVVKFIGNDDFEKTNAKTTWVGLKLDERNPSGSNGTFMKNAF